MKKTSRFILFILILQMYCCTYLPEEIELINGVELHETADYISLLPAGASINNTGLIFYAGALVNPHSYIPTLQSIVLSGYPVVIIKTVSNLAIFSTGKSKKITPHFPSVQRWVLGGHSLGAVVASMDIANSPSDYKGLLLLAGYPSNSDNLANWDGAVLSLYGELDGLATVAEVEEHKHLLPPGIIVDSLSNMPTTSTLGHTVYHEIKGGNHDQFGSYGNQNGDNSATISPAAQRKEVTDYLLSFFNANQW